MTKKKEVKKTEKKIDNLPEEKIIKSKFKKKNKDKKMKD